MALHGQIQVNGKTIGSWSAVRLVGSGPRVARGGYPKPDDVFKYDCHTHQLPDPGGRGPVLHEFIVEHRFGDGALVLASKLLAEAARLTDELVQA